MRTLISSSAARRISAARRSIHNKPPVSKEKQVSESPPQWAAATQETLVKRFGSSIGEEIDLELPAVLVKYLGGGGNDFKKSISFDAPGKPKKVFRRTGLIHGEPDLRDMNGERIRSKDRIAAKSFDLVTYGFLVTDLVSTGHTNIGNAIQAMTKVRMAAQKWRLKEIAMANKSNVNKFTARVSFESNIHDSTKVAQEWILQVSSAMIYIGCIGRDKSGEQMKNNCKQVDVNVQYYDEDQDTPTGTCAVCVVGGERSLVANLSSANRFNLAHLKRVENWAIVEKAKYFYITGFFLLVSPEFLQLVAEHAAANNKVFTMNLSAPFICEYFKDAHEKALPYVDIVFGNEITARTFSKVHGWETDNVMEIAVKISQWPKASGKHKRITVITQGADPVCVAEDGKVKLYPVIKLHKEEKLVDTNGGGDAFVGGFLSWLVQEKPIEECVRGGCHSANTIIQMSDCT